MQHVFFVQASAVDVFPHSQHHGAQKASNSHIMINIPAVMVLTDREIKSRVLFVWDRDQHK